MRCEEHGLPPVALTNRFAGDTEQKGDINQRTFGKLHPAGRIEGRTLNDLFLNASAVSLSPIPVLQRVHLQRDAVKPEPCPLCGVLFLNGCGTSSVTAALCCPERAGISLWSRMRPCVGI